MLALALACAFALTAQSATAAGNCYSQEGCTEQARSATAFTDTVGVQTKLGWSDSVYWSRWPMIRDRLLELGVSHIRDGTVGAAYPDVIGPTVAARFNELNRAGIKGNLLVGADQSHGTTVAQRLNWIKTNVPDFTMSIEGTNESDEDATAIRNMQCDIYQRAKADPVLASKPVLGPSAGPPFSESVWYDRVGDLSACLDKGNLHPYPGADPPHRHQSRDLSVAFARGRTTYGAKPQWITESGYWNNTWDTNNVSETASGIYVPRLFMENFRRGVERTQLYELIDLRPGSGAVLDNYGLLRADGSPKPAFTALKNLLAIVKDTSPASGSLGFRIACHTNCRNGHPDAWPTQDGPIRHLLLRQSSGAYILAVWSESKVWDRDSRTDTPKPAQGFTLTLHDAAARVDIFDPSRGTSPISTDTSGNKVLDTVAPDRLRLIKITPATAPTPGTTPSPPTAVELFEGESMTASPSAFARTESDATASAGKRLFLWHYATASKALTTSSSATRVVVRARGDRCREVAGIEAPSMTLRIDGVRVGSKDVASSTWGYYFFAADLPAGSHTVALSYDNDYEDAACNRGLYIDRVALEDVPES